MTKISRRRGLVVQTQEGRRRMHGVFSVFAGTSERSQQRIYTFMEDLCKSTTEIGEPCSPAFKGVQPHTRCKSSSGFHQLHIYLLMCFLLNLNVIKVTGLCKGKGISVISSGQPSQIEVSNIFPMRVLQTIYPFVVTRHTLQNTLQDKNSNTCFKCGCTGHFVKECPSPDGDLNSQQGEKKKAKAPFAATTKKEVSTCTTDQNPESETAEPPDGQEYA